MEESSGCVAGTLALVCFLEFQIIKYISYFLKINDDFLDAFQDCYLCIHYRQICLKKSTNKVGAIWLHLNAIKNNLNALNPKG